MVRGWGVGGGGWGWWGGDGGGGGGGKINHAQSIYFLEGTTNTILILAISNENLDIFCSAP